MAHQPSRLNQETCPALKPLLLATITAFGSQTAIGAETNRPFNIPAQTLGSALNHYADAADVQLSYPAALTTGVKSAGISGNYTAQQALQKLLSGTGVVAQTTENGTITLAKSELVETETKAKPSDLDTQNTTTLAPVSVTATTEYPTNPIDDLYNKDYAISKAKSATKTDAEIMDTPMSVQVVPKAVINDQQATGLENVLKNVSGVSPGWGFGADRNENLQIRGFSNNSIYRDGVLTLNNTNISLANAERVEVLKGPAGMLFGRTQPGGLVNVITKRPQKESYYSLQQQFGSFDTYRTLADATGALNKDGTLSYRLNYEHLDSNSFRDYLFDNKDFIAPSLTWEISKDTQLDLDFMYQNRKTMSESGIPYGLQVSGVIPGKIPLNFFRNEPTDYNNAEYYEADATLTHRFNEDWKIRGRFSFITQEVNTAQTSSNLNANLKGDLNRNFLKTKTDFDSEYGTVDITGHFATGEFKHTLLVGADYYQSSNANSSSTFRATGIPTINVFNPVYGFNKYLNDPLNPPNKPRNEWYGVYVQDQIELWDKWQLLFGSRFDHADFSVGGKTKSADEFSPRVGLSYRPVHWLSIYGDYVKTFNAVNQGTTVSGGIPDPEKSEEYEVGLKGEWWDGKLFANLAFYELTKRNVQTPLPAPYTNKVAVTGEQRSRGIELDLRGQLTDYANLIATYAYTDTEVTNDSAPFDFVIGSSGVGNAGRRFANVPRNAGSVWTTYDFSGIGAQGFSAGLGVFFASNRAGNINNSFYMPGYALLDGMLKYQHKFGPSNVTFQFNVDNLLDKEYYVSSNGFSSAIQQVIPGAPRTFMGSVKVEF